MSWSPPCANYTNAVYSKYVTPFLSLLIKIESQCLPDKGKLRYSMFVALYVALNTDVYINSRALQLLNSCELKGTDDNDLRKLIH